jgi:glucose-6-phosphate isomerase
MTRATGDARRMGPTGLDVHFDRERFTFRYGDRMFGPTPPEFRTLDAIRHSLLHADAQGPDPVYAIAMDVGRQEHLADLRRRMLLFGVVAYAAGRLGEEPVRSQGHIHRMAPHCGWSTPELVEVWEGRAIVYMQKRVADDPEYCVAVEAEPGEVVVIPPAWGHCIVNADPEREMVFGAFCDREYGFLYDAIRQRGGLSWFPVIAGGGRIAWRGNPKYARSKLDIRKARPYPELGLRHDISIYRQYALHPESMQWVSEPAKYAELWERFMP